MERKSGKMEGDSGKMEKNFSEMYKKQRRKALPFLQKPESLIGAGAIQKTKYAGIENQVAFFWNRA